jgi:transposase
MKNKHLPKQPGDAPASEGALQRPRAKFTDEFKRNAVARMREDGVNASLLALELGIRRNQLYKWADAIDKAEPGAILRSPGRPSADEESEIVRLRRQLARAEQELAVLKKFDAYLTRLKK